MIKYMAMDQMAPKMVPSAQNIMMNYQLWIYDIFGQWSALQKIVTEAA